MKFSGDRRQGGERDRRKRVTGGKEGERERRGGRGT